MSLIFHVTFEHKQGGQVTSMKYGTLNEAKQALDFFKKDWNCIGIEIILDITELIKE